MTKFIFGWLLQLYITAITAAGHLHLPEDILHKDLFQDYNPNVLPLPKDINKPLTIKLAVNLENLVDMNIQQQILIADFTFFLNWTNYQLQWNVSKYGGATSISVPKDKVWTPTLINFPKLKTLKSSGKVYIFHTGRSEYFFSQRITKSCKSNIDEFPSDNHKCKLEFLQFGFSPRVKLVSYKMPFLKDVKGNGAWRVDEIKRLNRSNRGISSVIMDLHLQRQPKYLTQKLVLPILILSVLPIFTLLIPMESGERISFAVTALLTVVVAFQYIMDQLPQNDSTPWIVNLSAKVVAGTFASLCISVINLHFFHHSYNGVLRSLITFITCCTTACHNKLQDKDFEPTTNKEEEDRNTKQQAVLGHTGSDNESWKRRVKIFDRICLLIVTMLWVVQLSAYARKVMIEAF